MRTFAFAPAASRRARAESIVPMINVVFLLLIFFMMSAQLAPPDPFELMVPQTPEGAAPEAGNALYISDDGLLAYGEARGEAVFAALAGHQGPLQIRADRALDGAALARVLRRLAQARIAEAILVSVPE